MQEAPETHPQEQLAQALRAGAQPAAPCASLDLGADKSSPAIRASSSINSPPAPPSAAANAAQTATFGDNEFSKITPAAGAAASCGPVDFRRRRGAAAPDIASEDDRRDRNDSRADAEDPSIVDVAMLIR